MTEIRPARKVMDYDTLSAEIDFKERRMVLTNRASGESITIPHDAYGELSAIMADLGRQLPGTPTGTVTRR